MHDRRIIMSAWCPGLEDDFISFHLVKLLSYLFVTSALTKNSSKVKPSRDAFVKLPWLFSYDDETPSLGLHLSSSTNDSLNSANSFFNARLLLSDVRLLFSDVKQA